MSTPDQRYREKLAARKEGRAPEIAAPVPVFSEGASVGDRYRQKLAARAAVAASPKPEKAKTDKAEAATAATEEAKIEEAARPDPKADQPKSAAKTDDKHRR